MNTTTTKPARTFGMQVNLPHTSLVPGHVVATRETVYVVLGVEGPFTTGTYLRRNGEDVIQYGELVVPGSVPVVAWMDPADWTVEYAVRAADAAV